MSRDLHDLDRLFHDAAAEMLARTAEDGYDLHPFYTLRTPFEQARIWRSTRALPEIEAAISDLDRRKAPWLSRVIDEVGPQSAPPGRAGHLTRALPGESWHQWGEALDCFVAENGRAVWDDGHPGYAAMAEAAQILGLEAGYLWTARDAVHVQARPEGGAAQAFDWPAIDAIMRSRFEGTEP